MSDRVVGYRAARAVTTFWNTWQYYLKEVDGTAVLMA
jgi:hypothetical protein